MTFQGILMKLFSPPPPNRNFAATPLDSIHTECTVEGKSKWHHFQVEAFLKYLVVPLTFALDCTYLHRRRNGGWGTGARAPLNARF